MLNFKLCFNFAAVISLLTRLAFSFGYYWYGGSVCNSWLKGPVVRNDKLSNSGALYSSGQNISDRL